MSQTGTCSFDFTNTSYNPTVANYTHDSTQNPFGGYISNLRVVKGVAVYTGNFSPPTSPLTATQSAGTNIAAITGTQTSLLTCQSFRFVDNSVANSGAGWTVTTSGTPSVQAFSPFAPQYQYTPSVTGGSGYFDGTGDYLVTSTTSAAFAYGTGDFTYSAWIYPLNVSGTKVIIDGRRSADKVGPVLYLDNATLTGAKNETTNVLSGGTVIANAWNFVELTRTSSNWRLFVNGSLTAGPTADAINYSANQVATIGINGMDGTQGFAGYIVDARVLKGTGGTSSTLPTAPLTAITNTQLLLNFTNAGIYDGTLKNNLETVGNAQVSTSVVKYGTGSMYFDGSGDYLSIPYNAALVFDSGNFTVECWFYLTGNAGINGNNERKAEFASCIVGIPTTAGWEFGLDGNSTTTGTGISFSNRINSSTAYTITATVTVNQNQWNHVAVVRNGTTTTIYLNGTSVGSGTLTNQSITSANSLWIGRQNVNNFNHDFPGYIDDLRITKGIARYTANFTPPTVALPRQ